MEGVVPPDQLEIEGHYEGEPRKGETAQKVGNIAGGKDPVSEQ